MAHAETLKAQPWSTEARFLLFLCGQLPDAGHSGIDPEVDFPFLDLSTSEFPTTQPPAVANLTVCLYIWFRAFRPQFKSVVHERLE